jgi:hypothetical protein
MLYFICVVFPHSLLNYTNRHTNVELLTVRHLAFGNYFRNFLWSAEGGGGGENAVRSWLCHCATSRKVAGSIPDDVIGIFHLPNSSGRTMALG